MFPVFTCERRLRRPCEPSGTARPAPHSMIASFAPSKTYPATTLIRRIWAIGSCGVPLEIAEHQDIGPRNGPHILGIQATAQRPASSPGRSSTRTESPGKIPTPHRLCIACHRSCRGLRRSRSAANPDRWKCPSTFEVKTNPPCRIRSAQPLQNCEARDAASVCTVELHPMPVEAPRQGRILREPARVGQRDEVEPQPLVWRIGPPEPLFPAKVGQTAIDPHPGAGSRSESPSEPAIDTCSAGREPDRSSASFTSSWTNRRSDRPTPARGFRCPRGSRRWP